MISCGIIDIKSDVTAEVLLLCFKVAQNDKGGVKAALKTICFSTK